MSDSNDRRSPDARSERDGGGDDPADQTVSARSIDDERADRSPLGEKLRAVGTAVGLGVGATILSFALIVGLVSVLQAFSIPLPESVIFLLGLEFLIGQLLVMGGLSAAYLYVTDRSISYLRIGVPTLRQLVVVLVAPFAVIIVSTAVSAVGLALGIESSSHAIAGLGNGNPILYLYLIPFMMLVVGPFEELLYRGVIQTRLRESFGPVPAIVLASLIFVSIHLPAYGLGNTVTSLAAIAVSLTALFGGSLIFGGIYEWTGNLTVVALIHGLYNSILFVLLYVTTVYEDEIAEMAEPAAVLVGF